MDTARLISSRARQVDASGIRRISELGKSLHNAINLSIGQPDFAVPEPIKEAACEAIRTNRNGYTPNPGLDALRVALAKRLESELGWRVRAPGLNEDSGTGLLITAGTSAAIMLACLALLDPGDEVIMPDPYFIIYPELAKVCGARAVLCDTYPDFRLTRRRVEPLITPRTKMVLLNSPGNPSGVVATSQEVSDLLALCRERDIVLLSDEIYDEFAFSDARTEQPIGPLQNSAAKSAPLLCPSPARRPGAAENTVLVRGFGKTYGVTGWRLGYVAGPMAIIEQMIKLQQHTIVCAPTPLQWGALAALDTPMDETVALYQRRRDRLVERLSNVTEVQKPGGAYYVFAKVPERLRMTASAFCEHALKEKVIIIPGNVFSPRDTHVRISFAAPDAMLDRGIEILARLMQG